MIKKSKTFFWFFLLFGGFVVLLLLIYRAERPKIAQHKSPPKGPFSSKKNSKNSYRRIICISPAVTELVFALGCGERVVGVSNFCTWPSEAVKKTSIGGAFNPNLERLTVLEPDVIITQGRSQKVTQFCKKQDITIINVELSNLETIYNDIKFLGAKLGQPERAEQLCGNIKEAMREVESKVSGRPKRRVFLSLGRATGQMAGLTSINGETFLSELITIAGGENIFADATRQYPQVSKETLLKRAAEIIIEALPGRQISQIQRERLRADWDVMASVPAVRNGCVRFLTEDYLLIPGPRMAQAARRLAEAIHPEAFKDD